MTADRRPTPAADLRARLAGIRGFLIDLDGVVILKGAPVPGAAEAIAALARRGTPYRFVTNTSMFSRRALAAWGQRAGMPVEPEQIVSALSASASWAARTYPGRPLFVIASDDALSEFAGQRLLSPAEADAPGAEAAAVIVGDSADALTHENVNRAFRLVQRGARLVGMHRNGWWLTPEGPTVDAGAYVVGLEFATSRRALIIGKPSRGIFGEAMRSLRADASLREKGGGGPLRREAVAMVGDDIRSDVLAAQRLGFRGVLVLTGKHGLPDVAAAAGGRGGGRPDAIAPSLSEVVAALD